MDAEQAAHEIQRLRKELGPMLTRGEDDGAVQFWRIKDHIKKYFPHCPHWSDDRWKKSMSGGVGNKKRFQYCTDSSGTVVYFRALQGHSGRSLIDPTLQDNVVFPSNFFQYIYHVGCVIDLHSLINSGLIPGCQNLSNRQTVFFLPEDPRDENHKNPDTIDLRAPRHAQYMHKWVEVTQEYGVLGRYQSCSQERIKVLSDTIERNHLLRHAPSLLFSESCLDGNWRNHIREGTCVTSASSQDLLKHGWKRELISEDMLNDQKDKLCSKSKVPNRTNQFQTQIKIERGNPLLKQEQPKRVHLMTARVSTLKMSRHMIERGNPLLEHTQIMRQTVAKHVPLMKAQA